MDCVKDAMRSCSETTRHIVLTPDSQKKVKSERDLGIQ